MATRSLGKLVLFSATAVLAAATAVAQTPGSGGAAQPQMPGQPTNPGMNSPGMNSPGMTPTTTGTSQQFGDKAFVSKALAGGEAEVQLGQLAEQKSQSQDVKQFAQKMVTDHSQLGAKLKPIAQQLGVPVPKEPSKKDKKLMEKLQGLSGQQFDNQYIQAMVKDHKHDLKDFQDEAQNAQDPNVKQAAQQGASVIQGHLQMIEQIAKSHNVSVDGKQSSGSM